MKKYLFWLILLTCLVYLNSFGNSFVWDDLNNIVNNEALKGPVRLKNIFLSFTGFQVFYRPFSYLTIFFDHRLWGNNPFGYHLTNFLFHLFNVILIFHIATRLTASRLISFSCASLFAIHPIQTEAVTYISGRSDPICTFFLLASFLLYIRSLYPVRKFFSNGVYTIKYRQLVYYSGSLLLFLFGLLSKEIAIIFPFIILVYNSLYLPRPCAQERGLDSPFKVRLKKAIPFFAISALFLLFRYIFLDMPTSAISLDRVILIPKFVLYYLKLLTFPFNLHMQHSLNGCPFLLNMPLILSALIILGFILIALRMSQEKFMRFGLLSFFIGAFPFLGIFRLNAEIAEHWLYFASFGFFLFMSGIFAQAKPLISRKLILSIAIVFFSILTAGRNAVWNDDISIYKNTLKYRPNDPKLHYNLGNAYLRKGLLDAAAKEYSIAIEGNPSYAYALNNLGLALEKQGDTKAAQTHYEMAIASDSQLDVAKKNLLRFGFTSLAFAQDSPRPFEKERGSGFDHTLYAEVLREFVDDGKVDYAALKNNHSTLDEYLKTLAELDNDALNSMPRNEKIAFYLNVYNALTLKVIVDYYPVKSIKDIPGVWDKIKFNVTGRELTLNQIEHQILRGEFKEPRIHFALVCASKGCPKLASEPFREEILNEQLDREARKFINDETKVKLDRNNGVLYISSIFKWFSEDFGDIIKFISKYLSEDDAEFIDKTKPKIRYLDYDWSLNEKL